MQYSLTMDSQNTMRRLSLSFLLTFALLTSTSITSAAEAGKTGNRLRAVLASSSQGDRTLVWVFFTDKGQREFQKASVPSDVVSPLALERRAKVLPQANLVDYSDLPVDDKYVQELAATGVEVQQRTKWFNGVSVLATPAQIEDLTRLPFVREVELTGRFKRGSNPEETGGKTAEIPLASVRKGLSTSSLDYGSSLAQLSLIKVPPIHDTGNNGQGIIVGVFDNGFRLPGHEAFSSMKIIATRDFVDRKTSVVPNDPNTSFGGHGVATLSAIGGYKPGALIGPAYGATYILARTENDSSETPLEEDKWVAAIEWAESLGVQVTSTSLGYDTFDAPYKSWTWQDMNGQTTVISRAAEMAVRKGVLVVNSAGNEGLNSAHNTLNAPADADSVLAVGAVTPGGDRAYFSSVGPSTSNPPHIKPDVMATGTSIIHASAISTTGYGISQGTSFACPLAAGVAALLMKAHPKVLPMAIVEAMKTTASKAGSPDNLMGYGIIDAVAANEYLNRFDTLQVTLPEGYMLAESYPNPFPSPSNPSARIAYGVPEAASVSLKVYDLLGREVRTLVSRDLAAGSYLAEWDGTNSNGARVASGMYLYRMETTNPAGKRSTATKRLVMVR
jgi:serine protease AprX